MRELVAAVRAANATRNPYAALVTAVALPDACAAIEAPDGKTSGTKYAAWWTTYAEGAFTHNDAEGTVYVTGRDAYALRCAVLHEASDSLLGQRVKDTVEHFRFVQPANPRVQTGIMVVSGVVSLGVDVFTEHICTGVEAWLDAMVGNDLVAERLRVSLYIDDMPNNVLTMPWPEGDAWRAGR